MVGSRYRLTRRGHLIETATALFCEHGYHATGIDKILDKAGVSEKTLYTHFRSKEELISEKDSPIRDISRQFKQLILDYIKDLCVEAAVEKPEVLADQLALILEGAIATAQVSQNPKDAPTAKDTAKVLIQQMLASF